MSKFKIIYQINNQEPKGLDFVAKIETINQQKIISKLIENNIISEEQNIIIEFIRYYVSKHKAMVLLKEDEDLKTKEENKILIKLKLESEKEKNILNQFIQIDNQLEDLSYNIKKKYSNNESENINNNNDSELDIAVLTGNPLINIINNKEEFKELSSMNDFNKLTNSIYNIIKTSNKILNAEFFPLTINNLKDIIKLKPKIIHLICKSTYIIDNNNIEDKFSHNYANLIFEDNKYFNMRAIKKEDLKIIFDERLINNSILIISTQLSKDIYEMVKEFKFQNILVQHTTIANLSFVEDFNYFFYRNLIEQMEYISIKDCNLKALNMSKNKNFQFCCCFHSHDTKKCELFKNLENELYICNDIDNKNNKNESFFIPHFTHLSFKCDDVCKRNRHKKRDDFNFHLNECNNIVNKSSKFICCCKKIDEIKQMVHKNEFSFHNFSEKDNNIKLGCGKDGISIIKNTENIPNYELMKVVTGRNKIIYDIYKELFELNNNFINIYNKENDIFIYEFIELTDIIIEYLKERINNDNDNDLENIKKSKSIKINNETPKFDLKHLKSSPNLSITNINYCFEKKIIKKDEKFILNEYDRDNKIYVYFLIILNDEIRDKIFSELSRKEHIKIVFMSKDKMNAINNIELTKKNEINYKIKYQYKKINDSKLDFDNFIKAKMIENKDIEKLEIDLESNLKCEILYLFHLLKNGFYEMELKELFQISNYEIQEEEKNKENEINKIKTEINNIKNIIKEEELKDKNIEDMIEQKIINNEEKDILKVSENNFNNFNEYIEKELKITNLNIKNNIIEKEKTILKIINEFKKSKYEKVIDIIEIEFKMIISKTKIHTDKDYFIYKKIALYDNFNTNYNNWKNKITDKIKGKVLLKLFEYYSNLFRYLINIFKKKYPTDTSYIKYKSGFNPAFSLISFSANQNLGIWKKSKEIEDNEIKIIQFANLQNIISYIFKFFDYTARNFSNFFNIDNIHLCMNNINNENKKKVIKYIEDLSISYYTCIIIYDAEFDLTKLKSIFVRLFGDEKEEYKFASLRFGLMDCMHKEKIEHDLKYINELDGILKEFKKMNCFEGELETMFAKFIIYLEERENWDNKRKLYKEILFRLNQIEDKNNFIELFRNKVKYFYLRNNIKIEILNNENYKEIKKEKKILLLSMN